jgi:hypothetical protein
MPKTYVSKEKKEGVKKREKFNRCESEENRGKNTKNKPC